MANNKDQDDLQDDSVDQGDEEFYDDQDDSGHEDSLGEGSDGENWGEEDESSSSSKQGKKKSSLSTIAIIAGGVVVGLIVLYLQFGGSGSQPSPEGMGAEPEIAAEATGAESPPQPDPQPVDTQAQQSASVVPPSPQESPSSLEALRNANGAVGIETVDPAVKAASMEKDPAKETSKGGFMNDPSLLPSEVHGVAPPVVERPAEPTMTAPSKKPSAAVAEVENPVTPVSDFPTVDAIKKPDAGGGEQSAKPLEEQPAGTESPIVTQTPAPVQPAVAQDVPSEDVKILKAQLETALKRIEDLEKKTDQPVVATPATNSEEVESLRTALDRLQSKVESLSAEKLSLQKKEAAAVSEPLQAEEKPVKTSSSNRKSEAGAVKIKKSSVVWDLKGAMPGQAMIAVHGERDLKMVRVGDEVSGIGRVTAIENSGHGWIVQGTSGQIKQ